MEAYLRGGGVSRHRPWLTAFQRCCFALLLVPGDRGRHRRRRQGRRRYDFRDEGGRAASGTAAESNAWSSCRTQLRRGAATVPDRDGGTLATAAQRSLAPDQRLAALRHRLGHHQVRGAGARRQIRFRLSELAAVPGGAEIPRLPRARARRAAAPGNHRGAPGRPAIAGGAGRQDPRLSFAARLRRHAADARRSQAPRYPARRELPRHPRIGLPGRGPGAARGRRRRVAFLRAVVRDAAAGAAHPAHHGAGDGARHRRAPRVPAPEAERVRQTLLSSCTNSRSAPRNWASSVCEGSSSRFPPTSSPCAA